MISFEPSEEQSIARSMIDEFARSVIAPAARGADLAEAMEGSWIGQLWDLGVIQSQADDSGISPVTNAILLEGLAKGDASAAGIAAASMAFVQAIATQGSARQREAILPQFQGGDPRLAALAVSEPRLGGDMLRPATSAVLSGESYLLRGTKSMIPCAIDHWLRRGGALCRQAGL